MSSLNPHYTFEYSQPSEYHFSHDSVFMARRIFEYYRDSGVMPERGLDLCAGCGIIGLDFLFHCQNELKRKPKTFDFLEVQSVYTHHFSENAQRAKIENIDFQFLNENYDQLLFAEYSGQYDLILCNPPYFYPGQGRLSPSEFKNRCRFFLDSDLKNLIGAIENSLTPMGEAFILLRDQVEHGWNPQLEVQKILSSNLKLEALEDIRGTSLIKISR